MNKRENQEVESGSFNLIAVALAAIAICAAAILLMPAHASTERSDAGDATYAAVSEGTGYLPAQLASQATAIETMRDMAY